MTYIVPIVDHVLHNRPADGRVRAIIVYPMNALINSQKLGIERFFANRKVARVVMEACGSAHHWARVFVARGMEVILLPAHYVRAYVRRSKTDAADALALLEAVRCADIVAVKVKSVRAAKPAGATPYPLAVDGHAYLAH